MVKKLIVLLFCSVFLFSGCKFLPSDDGENDSLPDKSASGEDVGGDFEVLEGKVVGYSLKYDEDKWVLSDVNENLDSEYELSHVDGDVYVAVIAERIPMSLDGLKEIAMDNARSVSSGFELVSEEKKTINGNDVLVLQMEVEIEKIPFTYYGYYFTGEAGSIQFVTFTGQNLFDEYMGDLEELLGSLEISGVREFLREDRGESMQLVEGKRVNYGITYDENTWILREGGLGSETEYEFDHVDGDVYAVVIPERLQVPLDSLKELALINAEDATDDGKATVVSEEVIDVDGVDLLVMKLRGVIATIPFEYYGYYYAGDAGTIQFITYSSEALAPFYEDDLTKLLNGLRIYSD